MVNIGEWKKQNQEELSKRTMTLKDLVSMTDEQLEEKFSKTLCGICTKPIPHYEIQADDVQYIRKGDKRIMVHSDCYYNHWDEEFADDPSFGLYPRRPLAYGIRGGD